MTLRQTLRAANSALSLAKIDHALIGGLALATLGVNRATGDVDLMIEGEYRDAAKTALGAAGFRLRQESDEVLHFDGLGFLDILLAKRPLSKAMLANARHVSTVGMKCLSAEDIIGLKIQAYINDGKREYQDKADIRALIDKNPGLDWGKVKTYADLFQQWSEIEKIRDKK